MNKQSTCALAHTHTHTHTCAKGRRGPEGVPPSIRGTGHTKDLCECRARGDLHHAAAEASCGLALREQVRGQTGRQERATVGWSSWITRSWCCIWALIWALACAIGLWDLALLLVVPVPLAWVRRAKGRDAAGRVGARRPVKATGPYPPQHSRMFMRGVGWIPVALRPNRPRSAWGRHMLSRLCRIFIMARKVSSLARAVDQCAQSTAWSLAAALGGVVRGSRSVIRGSTPKWITVVGSLLRAGATPRARLTVLRRRAAQVKRRAECVLRVVAMRTGVTVTDVTCMECSSRARM